MDVVLIEHSAIQLSLCLAAIADPGVSFVLQRSIASDNATKYLQLFTFVSSVLSTMICGSPGLEPPVSLWIYVYIKDGKSCHAWQLPPSHPSPKKALLNFSDKIVNFGLWIIPFSNDLFFLCGVLGALWLCLFDCRNFITWLIKIIIASECFLPVYIPYLVLVEAWFSPC